MKTNRRLWLSLAALLVSVEARAYCPTNRFAGNRMIVKLADSTTPQTAFEGIGVDTAQAEARLQRAIYLLNTYLNSNMQLQYGGRGCTYNNATDHVVCVHAWNCNNGPATCDPTSQACEFELAIDGNGYVSDAAVQIVGGANCAPHNIYEDYPWNVDLTGTGQKASGTEDDLVGTLIHELFHAVGANHTGTCDTGSKIFSGDSESPLQRYASLDDIAAARSMYGSDTLPFNYAESSSFGALWQAGPVANSSGRSYRFGSITNNTNYLGTVGPWYFDNAVYFKKLDGSGWSTSLKIDSTTSGVTYEPASIAFGNGKLMAVWLANESTATYFADLRYAISNDNGATWPTTGYLTKADGTRFQTTRKAVNIGYDQISNRFLIVWHNNLDQLSYLTAAATAPENAALYFRGSMLDSYTGDDPLQNAKTLDGASVVCHTFPDGANCMIMFAEMHDDYCHVYRQGTINASGAWVTDQVRTQCIKAFGAPTVSTDPGDGTYPFKLAGVSPTSTLFTYDKVTTDTQFWSATGLYSTGALLASPPSLGAWFNGSTWKMEMLYVPAN